MDRPVMDPELQRIGQLFTDRIAAITADVGIDDAVGQWLLFHVLVMTRCPDESFRQPIESLMQGILGSWDRTLRNRTEDDDEPK